MLATVAAVAALLAAWQMIGPEKPVRVPALHPPHAVKAVAAPRPTGTEDDPPVDDSTPPPAPAASADEPTRRDLEAGMEKTKKHVAHCQSLEQFAGTLQVRVVIGKSGSVQSVSVLPPVDKTETAACVIKAVKTTAAFPRFKGELTPSVELVYPFYFRADGVM
jgi:hypothetical protein